MNTLDITLWFFAAALVFGSANLVAARMILPKRAAQATTVTDGPRLAPQTIIDVLALALIVVALMAALMVDLLFIRPLTPEVGRALMYVIGALLTFVLRRLFVIMPNTPVWLPRFMRGLEILLLALGLLGLLLAFVIRPV